MVQPCPNRCSSQLMAAVPCRRDVVSWIAAAAVMITTTGTCRAPAAHASYSAYAHREDDWKERVDKGNIEYSTAKQLRKQLQELVPTNSESSKIFCPNGPTAAVSPLMENRCSDQLAQPSIYGSTQDSVGNVVPGMRKTKG